MSRNQRGQAIPFVVLFVLVVMISLRLLLFLGVSAGLRSQTQAGADAAALAGALDGEISAHRIAKENKVELTQFEIIGSDVRVVVRRGKISASARARNELPANLRELPPVFRAALARSQELTGRVVTVQKYTENSVKTGISTAHWVSLYSEETGLCLQGKSTFVVC